MSSRSKDDLLICRLANLAAVDISEHVPSRVHNRLNLGLDYLEITEEALHIVLLYYTAHRLINTCCIRPVSTSTHWVVLWRSHVMESGRQQLQHW